MTQEGYEGERPRGMIETASGRRITNSTLDLARQWENMAARREGNEAADRRHVSEVVEAAVLWLENNERLIITRPDDLASLRNQLETLLGQIEEELQYDMEKGGMESNIADTAGNLERILGQAKEKTEELEGRG